MPINLLILLTPSERDVFNVIRHLRNEGVRAISLSLFRLYTGLTDKTVRKALASLIDLGFITKGRICKKGTCYNIEFKKFGNAIKALNAERNPVERLRLADRLRGTGRKINRATIKDYQNTEFDTINQ